MVTKQQVVVCKLPRREQNPTEVSYVGSLIDVGG
jgi:hypothetical protein